MIATLIPADSADTAVTVNSFDAIDPQIKVIATPFLETVGGVFRQWGGAVGLALFAMWALWMLNKSMTKLAVDESQQTAGVILHALDEEETEEVVEASEPTKRDALQSVVQDNPEMTAAVLGKWIQAAN